MEEVVNEVSEVPEAKEKIKVGQEQIHGLLFSDKLSWNAIIHDLINTEQLDPWDIDLSLLANKYLERVRELEEANFLISSKVLLAAAILLHIKSRILLDDYIPSLDEILFGKKEHRIYTQERITLDDEIPGLVPRTPLPRYRKVTLDELMTALGKAINTETRRIRKVVVAKQQEMETSLSLPKKRINLQDRIREVYAELKERFKDNEEKLAFSDLSGLSNDDKIATFVPLLHLDNQHKVWLEQNGHLEEIWILLKHIYEKQNAVELEKMRLEAEEEMKKYHSEMSAEEKERADLIEKDFQNPLGN